MSSKAIEVIWVKFFESNHQTNNGLVRRRPVHVAAGRTQAVDTVV